MKKSIYPPLKCGARYIRSKLIFYLHLHKKFGSELEWKVGDRINFKKEGNKISFFLSQDGNKIWNTPPERYHWIISFDAQKMNINRKRVLHPIHCILIENGFFIEV